MNEYVSEKDGKQISDNFPCIKILYKGYVWLLRIEFLGIFHIKGGLFFFFLIGIRRKSLKREEVKGLRLRSMWNRNFSKI